MWGSCISQLLCTITRYLRIPEANNVERERAYFYPLSHVFYAKILCLFCFRPLAKAEYQGRRTWQTQLLCLPHELKVMRDWGPTVLLRVCPQWLRDLLALYPKGASSTTLGTKVLPNGPYYTIADIILYYNSGIRREQGLAPFLGSQCLPGVWLGLTSTWLLDDGKVVLQMTSALGF